MLEGTTTRLRRLRARESAPAGADAAVSDLYSEHRLGLTRLALLLTDDEASAQDVVQDAFLGLYAAWPRLRSPDRALAYLRSAVLNGSRSMLRRRRTARGYVPPHVPNARSAESLAMLDAGHREVVEALGRIGQRQREVLVLRYWADLSEGEIAVATGLSRGAVKSTASRGLVALHREMAVSP